MSYLLYLRTNIVNNIGCIYEGHHGEMIKYRLTLRLRHMRASGLEMREKIALRTYARAREAEEQ